MKNDLTGKKFGRWSVIEFSYSRNGSRYYKCLCDCGTERIIRGTSLTSENTRSCGCYRNEMTGQRSKIHGQSDSRINRIYRNMKTRCCNPKNPNYKRYGAKGIRICDEWLGDDGFNRFYEWSMKNGYSDKLSIDRIDGGKGYSPSNCRWTTAKGQANNLKTNINITYNGETHTLAEWSELTGISRRTIQERYKRGLPLSKVFSYQDLRYRKEHRVGNY